MKKKIFTQKVELHYQERYIAPNFKVKNLNRKRIKKIIRFFEKRIYAFYIKPIETLINTDDSDFGFTVIGLSFTILDLLSLYYHPKEISDEGNFVYFIEEYSPSLSNTIQPNHYYYNYNYDNYPKSTFIKTSTEKISQMLWRTFRHGIIHNGKVMSFGQYDWASKGFSSFYDERSWPDVNTKNRYELWLNPSMFFNEVKRIFKEYLKELKKSKSSDDIRINFIKKFEWDYGYGP